MLPKPIRSTGKASQDSGVRQDHVSIQDVLGKQRQSLVDMLSLLEGEGNKPVVWH